MNKTTAVFLGCVCFVLFSPAVSSGSDDVPMPTGVELTDIYCQSHDCSSSATSTASSQVKQASPRSEDIARATVAGTVAGTAIGSVVDWLFSSDSPSPQPTPAEIEAQRRAQEAALAEQRRMEEQKRQKFLQSRQSLIGRLKGVGPTYTFDNADAGIRTTEGIVLKPLPPVVTGAAAKTGFFGIKGAVAPKDAGLKVSADAELGTDVVDWRGKSLDEINRGMQSLVSQRLESPNKWAASITRSLKTKAPPLPYKKFDELQPGDILLVYAEGSSKIISWADKKLSGSSAGVSHTVLFLRDVNGKKFFLDDQPGQGPRIILQDELIATYGKRGSLVAKLAQPLNEAEAKTLYAAAVELAAKNRRNIIVSPVFGTDYGAWGKEDMVCSEADWALLNTARPGNRIPATSDKVKANLFDVAFSPADVSKNGQYFLVSPMDMPEKRTE